MSLNVWEQQTLNSIGHGLAGSDPQLAALLGTFTRLASGEEMPAGEEIGARSRRPIRRLLHKRWYRCRVRGCRHMRQKRRHLRLHGGAVLLWLAVTAAAISSTRSQVRSDFPAASRTCAHTGSRPGRAALT